MDGGPTKNEYLMRFQSSMLQTPVCLPDCEESSALGAALMAGITYGLYTMELLTHHSARQQFQPAMMEDERNEKYAGWKAAVKKVL